MSQFCTCHDSWAVMTCANLWHDWIITSKIRAIKFLEDFINELITLLWNGPTAFVVGWQGALWGSVRQGVVIHGTQGRLTHPTWTALCPSTPEKCHTCSGQGVDVGSSINTWSAMRLPEISWDLSEILSDILNDVLKPTKVTQNHRELKKRCSKH